MALPYISNFDPAVRSGLDVRYLVVDRTATVTDYQNAGNFAGGDLNGAALGLDPDTIYNGMLVYQTGGTSGLYILLDETAPGMEASWEAVQNSAVAAAQSDWDATTGPSVILNRPDNVVTGLAVTFPDSENNSLITFSRDTDMTDQVVTIVGGTNVMITEDSGSISISSVNTEYAQFVKETADAAADGIDGLVPAPDYNGGIANRFLREDGMWHGQFVGATMTESGADGLVPAPDFNMDSDTRFLKEDGSWDVPVDTQYNTFEKATDVADSEVDGLVPGPDYNAGSDTRFLKEDGTWDVPVDTDTTYVTFTEETADAAGDGVDGLVPAPEFEAGETRFLREDATWVVPTDTNTFRPITVGSNDPLENTEGLSIAAGTDVTITEVAGLVTINSPQLTNAEVLTRLNLNDGTIKISGDLLPDIQYGDVFVYTSTTATIENFITDWTAGTTTNIEPTPDPSTTVMHSGEIIHVIVDNSADPDTDDVDTVYLYSGDLSNFGDSTTAPSRANFHRINSGDGVTSITSGDGITTSPAAGITSSGSIAVDSTVVRTTGTQNIAGPKTFTDGDITTNFEGSVEINSELNVIDGGAATPHVAITPGQIDVTADAADNPMRVTPTGLTFPDLSTQSTGYSFQADGTDGPDNPLLNRGISFSVVDDAMDGTIGEVRASVDLPIQEITVTRTGTATTERGGTSPDGNISLNLAPTGLSQAEVDASINLIRTSGSLLTFPNNMTFEGTTTEVVSNVRVLTSSLTSTQTFANGDMISSVDFTFGRNADAITFFNTFAPNEDGLIIGPADELPNISDITGTNFAVAVGAERTDSVVTITLDNPITYVTDYIFYRLDADQTALQRLVPGNNLSIRQVGGTTVLDVDIPDDPIEILHTFRAGELSLEGPTSLEVTLEVSDDPQEIRTFHTSNFSRGDSIVIRSEDDEARGVILSVGSGILAVDIQEINATFAAGTSATFPDRSQVLRQVRSEDTNLNREIPIARVNNNDAVIVDPLNGELTVLDTRVELVTPAIAPMFVDSGITANVNTWTPIIGNFQLLALSDSTALAEEQNIRIVVGDRNIDGFVFRKVQSDSIIFRTLTDSGSGQITSGTVQTVQTLDSGTAAIFQQVGAILNNDAVSFVGGELVIEEGRPGAQGRYDIEIFIRAADEPDRPTGGTIDANGNLTTPPTGGWTTAIPDGTTQLWQSRFEYNPASPVTDPGSMWSPVFQAGSQGPPGVQGFQGIGINTVTGATDADTGLTTVTVALTDPAGSTPAPANQIFTVPRGVQGVAGNTILSGEGAPANNLGDDGDFYIDTLAGLLLGPKVGGVWPTTGIDLVGMDGMQGDTGRGITSITGPTTVDLVDTYTINYSSDPLTSTFTVTNGADGADGVDGMNGMDGDPGADGRGITNITGPVTSGLEDTYTINYDSGTPTSTYVVTNGAAGAAGADGAQGDRGEQGLQGREEVFIFQNFATQALGIAANAPTDGTGITTAPTGWVFGQNFTPDPAQFVFISTAIYDPAATPGALTWIDPYEATGATGPQGAMGSPGTPGMDGRDGTDGTDGTDGAAAAFTGNGIGTVTGLPSGATPVVTVEGDAQGFEFNFSLPAGPQGEMGDQGIQGDPGPQGRYEVDLYQSASSAPADPTGDITYNTSTHVFSDLTNANGWLADIPTIGTGEALWILRDYIDPVNAVNDMVTIAAGDWLDAFEAGSTTQGPRGPAGAMGAMGNPGTDGDGWTGGSYNAGTGVVTFASDDNLGFATGDLRGAAGSDGAPGAPGADGADGNDGADGDSVSIAANTANTATSYVLDITSTPGDGTAATTVMTPNLIGPQGPAGGTGASGYTYTLRNATLDLFRGSWGGNGNNIHPTPESDFELTAGELIHVIDTNPDLPEDSVYLFIGNNVQLGTTPTSADFRLIDPNASFDYATRNRFKNIGVAIVGYGTEDPNANPTDLVGTFTKGARTGDATVYVGLTRPGGFDNTRLFRNGQRIRIPDSIGVIRDFVIGNPGGLQVGAVGPGHILIQVPQNYPDSLVLQIPNPNGEIGGLGNTASILPEVTNENDLPFTSIRDNQAFRYIEGDERDFTAELIINDTAVRHGASSDRFWKSIGTVSSDTIAPAYQGTVEGAGNEFNIPISSGELNNRDDIGRGIRFTWTDSGNTVVFATTITGLYNNVGVAIPSTHTTSITIPGNATVEIEYAGQRTITQIIGGTVQDTGGYGPDATLTLPTPFSGAYSDLSGAPATITNAQANAITANSAKVGITQEQSDAIVSNTAKTLISSVTVNRGGATDTGSVSGDSLTLNLSDHTDEGSSSITHDGTATDIVTNIAGGTFDSGTVTIPDQLQLDTEGAGFIFVDSGANVAARVNGPGRTFNIQVTDGSVFEVGDVIRLHRFFVSPNLFTVTINSITGNVLNVTIPIGTDTGGRLDAGRDVFIRRAARGFESITSILHNDAVSIDNDGQLTISEAGTINILEDNDVDSPVNNVSGIQFIPGEGIAIDIDRDGDNATVTIVNVGGGGGNTDSLTLSIDQGSPTYNPDDITDSVQRATFTGRITAVGVAQENIALQYVLNNDVNSPVGIGNTITPDPNTPGDYTWSTTIENRTNNAVPVRFTVTDSSASHISQSITTSIRRANAPFAPAAAPTLSFGASTYTGFQFNNIIGNRIQDGDDGTINLTTSASSAQGWAGGDVSYTIGGNPVTAAITVDDTTDFPIVVRAEQTFSYTYPSGETGDPVPDVTQNDITRFTLVRSYRWGTIGGNVTAFTEADLDDIAAFTGTNRDIAFPDEAVTTDALTFTDSSSLPWRAYLVVPSLAPQPTHVQAQGGPRGTLAAQNFTTATVGGYMVYISERYTRPNISINYTFS